MTDAKKSLGPTFRTARVLLDLSLIEVAKRLGISVVELAEYERGAREPADWDRAFGALRKTSEPEPELVAAAREVAQEVDTMFAGGGDGGIEKCHECDLGPIGNLRDAMYKLRPLLAARPVGFRPSTWSDDEVSQLAAKLRELVSKAPGVEVPHTDACDVCMRTDYPSNKVFHVCRGHWLQRSMGLAGLPRRQGKPGAPPSSEGPSIREEIARLDEKSARLLATPSRPRSGDAQSDEADEADLNAAIGETSEAMPRATTACSTRGPVTSALSRADCGPLMIRTSVPSRRCGT